MPDMPHSRIPSLGDAVSAIRGRRLKGMSQTATHHRRADAARRRLPRLALDQHLRAAARRSSPAATSARSSCRPRAGSACKVGDRAVVGWSIGGELHELRTRVVRGLRHRVGADGLAPRDHHPHRRPPRRRALRARRRRQPAARRDREVLGFTHDLSIHGVGLLLEGETPGARHARRARGAGRARRAAAARRTCASCTRARRAQEGVARVGLALRRPGSASRARPGACSPCWPETSV